jgi:SAM-dependent methyltransferase
MRFQLIEVYRHFFIYECLECGLQFADPLEYDPQAYEQAYKGTHECLDPGGEYWRVLSLHAQIISSGKIEEMWMFLRGAQRLAIEWLEKNIPRSSIILDLGCGTGLFLMALKNKGFIPLGMDIAQFPIDMLRKQGYQVAVGSIEDYPADWPTPSVITAFEVLEHLPNPVAFLASIHERFPGSILMLSVPSPKRWMPFGARGQGDYPPHHLTRWTPQALQIALKRAGYMTAKVFFPPAIIDEISGTGLGIRIKSLGNKVRKFSKVHTASKQKGQDNFLSSIDKPPAILGVEKGLLQIKRVIFFPLAVYLRLKGYSAISMLAVGFPGSKHGA